MGETVKQLCTLGVSFRNAPAATREQFSFDGEEAAALLKQAAADSPEMEALILSTCIRTEIYLASPPGPESAEHWLKRLRRLRPGAPILDQACFRYTLVDSQAARHLFRVAAGLESAVLGDAQIFGQVKESYRIAAASGSAGKYMNRLLQLALRTGKRARSETAISRGAASTGSAVISMVCAHAANGADPRPLRLLIVGAGKIASDVGRHAAKRWPGPMVFINRTGSKSAKLAALCGGEWAGWDGLDEVLRQADCVVVATSARQPVLKCEQLDRVARLRSGRKGLIVDAGMPRNVEASARWEILDIDSIQDQQSTAMTLRQSAVPEVERIVEEQVLAWERWTAKRSGRVAFQTLQPAMAPHAAHGA